MSNHRERGFVTRCFYLSLYLIISSLILVKVMANSADRESELPIRNIELTIHNDQREQLFSQFRKFAEKHGFAIRIALTSPNGEDYSIQLWREDFKIFGDNPFEPTKFEIGIYQNDESAQDIPPSYLDALISDLEAFVSVVPNATFFEKE